jgi:cell division protein FtsW (lipid II flippase)
MFELLQNAAQIFFWAKIVFFVAAGLTVLVSVGILIYILNKTFSPAIRVAQWMIWYTPGKEPHPALAGVSHGLRLVMWSGVIGLGLWLAVHTIGR